MFFTVRRIKKLSKEKCKVIGFQSGKSETITGIPTIDLKH